MAQVKPRGAQLNIQDVASTLAADSTSNQSVAAGIAGDSTAILTITTGITTGSPLNVLDTNYIRRAWGITNVAGVGSPVAGTAYAATIADDVIIVDATLGDVTITLHSAATARFRPLQIKRVDASSNVLTVVGNGSPVETIDGQTSITVSGQYTNMTIINDSTLWHIL